MDRELDRQIEREGEGERDWENQRMEDGLKGEGGKSEKESDRQSWRE